MKREFICEWEHQKRHGPVTIKNIQRLFDNLEIEVLKVVEEEVDRRRIKTIFTLYGSEPQQQRLNYYMEKVRQIS